jgi:exodeoxyribonuclease V beta subunit
LHVPGYDYEKHFGCVHYLFVRGMSPDLDAERGVFTDRPTAGLVRGLDELLDGSGGSK